MRFRLPTFTCERRPIRPTVVGRPLVWLDSPHLMTVELDTAVRLGNGLAAFATSPAAHAALTETVERYFASAILDPIAFDTRFLDSGAVRFKVTGDHDAGHFPILVPLGSSEGIHLLRCACGEDHTPVSQHVEESRSFSGFVAEVEASSSEEELAQLNAFREHYRS